LKTHTQTILQTQTLPSPNLVPKLVVSPSVYNASLVSINPIHFHSIAQHKKSQECPYYLSFILEHYHSLPEWTAFTHGRPDSHNPNMFAQLEWLYTKDNATDFLRTSNLTFIHLNCQIWVKRTMDGPWMFLAGYNKSDVTAWPHALTFLDQGRRVRIETQCCAQFLVHKSKILAHPLSFYETLLKLTIEHGECATPEHSWHVWFGEPAILDRRKNVLHELWLADPANKAMASQWNSKGELNQCFKQEETT
jgi:hypothetical protein